MLIIVTVPEKKLKVLRIQLNSSFSRQADSKYC